MAKAFIHEKALCETPHIGEGTRLWPFSHVLAGARVGRDCNVCENVFIEADVVVGDNVTIKNGVQLWNGVRIGDGVFIGPNATFTNDGFPRSSRRPEKFLPTIVEQGASVGANATLLSGLTIGRNAMVGAGAVVTQDVPPNAVVAGNPARILRYVTGGDEQDRPMEIFSVDEDTQAGSTPARIALGVGRCELWTLPFFRDMRGSLVATEFAEVLPFEPVRSFLVFDVPSDRVRGEHAHRECDQFLVAVHGSLSIVVDDGISSKEMRLDSPRKGVYVPSGIWGTQYKFDSDTVMCVFASQPYRADDYIRDYDEFLKHAKRR